MKQSENRYYGYMRRLGLTKFDEGVTAHGLRAEYAENMLILRGLMPPSLGGTAAQMPKAQRDEILQDAANKLGHNDLHTSSAYYSTFRKSYTKGNLGGKVGRVIVVDREQNHFAVLYSNPLPKADDDGTFEKLSASAVANTAIALVLEKPGQGDENVGLQEFIAAYPHLADRVRAQLESVGL